jgi:NADH-quinone oxidoreductase subunit M
VFFEGVLIPMFIIIGVWGGPRRVYSAFKFFLFTLLGSVLMLVAILTMYDQAGTTDIPTSDDVQVRASTQIWLWLALFASVRGQGADVAGPHLAARRARRGADGGLGHPGRRAAEDGRLRLPALLDPDPADASTTLAPLVFGLSIIAVIYTSLVALRRPT